MGFSFSKTSGSQITFNKQLTASSLIHHTNIFGLSLFGYPFYRFLHILSNHFQNSFLLGGFIVTFWTFQNLRHQRYISKLKYEGQITIGTVKISTTFILVFLLFTQPFYCINVAQNCIGIFDTGIMLVPEIFNLVVVTIGYATCRCQPGSPGSIGSTHIIRLTVNGYIREQIFSTNRYTYIIGLIVGPVQTQMAVAHGKYGLQTGFCCKCCFRFIERQGVRFQEIICTA